MVTKGKRLPRVVLGQLVDNDVRHVDLDLLLSGKRALLIGVIGAYTPICTEKHIPDFIAEADSLRRAGFTQIVCVCPNDPWTTAAWAEEVDPTHRITFLSDGNLELAGKLGVLMDEPSWFLGRRPRRYLAQTRNAVIERIAIENGPVVLSCTRSQDVFLPV